MTEPSADDCTCPYVVVGLHRTNSRCLSELCVVHGIGSEHWRGLPQMPYGYADSRSMTREEYLNVLDQCPECGHSLPLKHDNDDICIECEEARGPCRDGRY